MTRGLHRAPSRLSRSLDRWQAQPYIVQWLIAAVAVLVVAGLLRAASQAHHQDQPTQPTQPTAPVVSASPTSMPRVVR